MPKYLLTGDGRRLLTGGDQPLMADGPGPAFSELEAAPATISVSGSASPVAVAALGAAALFSISGAAQASASATAALEPASITVSGTAEPFTESSAAGVIRITGSAQVSADAWLEPEPATIVVTGSAAPMGVRAVDPASAAIRVTGSATGAASSAPLEAAPAVIRITGTASPSVNTGAKFRSYWLQAYIERQEVLNAIDAANRLLAKEAGDKANANAEAIILTNAEVSRIDGRVTSEAERTTLLTATVDDLGAELIQTQKAMSDGDSALAAQIAQTNINLEGKASTEALNAQIVRIDQHGEEISLHSDQIQQTQATLAGKADTSAVNSLSSEVQGLGDQVAATSSAITRVSASTLSPGVNLVPNSSGEFGTEGWSGTNGAVSVFDAAGGKIFRVARSGSGPFYAYANIPASPGLTYTLGADVSWASGSGTIRADIQWLGGSGDTPDGTTTVPGRIYSTGVAPSGTTGARIRIWSADASGSIINFSRVKLEVGSEATPFTTDASLDHAAAVTQSMRAEVDSVTGKVNASYTVNLNANGYHSGVLAQNNGQVSSWRFLTDTFAIYNTSGAGLSWTNGNLWNSRGTYSLITGPDLGEGMLLYIGNTPISPQQARKADAIFYVDSNGVGYFAGQVLQGVLRAFNSTTTLSIPGPGLVEAITDFMSSNGKPVALTAKFRRGYRQTYNGGSSVITLGGGTTQATVQIRRQFEGSGWEIIANEVIYGTEQVFNEAGVPSFIVYNLAGEVLATDPPDLRRRRYTVTVTNLAWRTHTVANPGTTAAPVNNQYQSIESME